MDSPAKQIAVYPGRMAEGLCATLASVAELGTRTAVATARTFVALLNGRTNKDRHDHVAHILMAGPRLPGYEDAFEILEEMTEAQASDVFLCMARLSARWDRAYQDGADPFGEVRQFLDRLPADRMADQKTELFHRLALDAIDKITAARAVRGNRRRANHGRGRQASPLQVFHRRAAVRPEIPNRRWESR